MTRLELLKKELKIVKNLECMYFGTKDLVIEQYNREIDAIGKWGAKDYEIGNNPYQE